MLRRTLLMPGITRHPRRPRTLTGIAAVKDSGVAPFLRGALGGASPVPSLKIRPYFAALSDAMFLALWVGVPTVLGLAVRRWWLAAAPVVLWLGLLAFDATRLWLGLLGLEATRPGGLDGGNDITRLGVFWLVPMALGASIGVLIGRAIRRPRSRNPATTNPKHDP